MLFAHALGAPIELPLPLSVFLYGSSAVLVFSFVALGLLWRKSRFEGGGAEDGRVLPEPIQGALRGAAVAGRAVVLAVFVFVFYAGLVGEDFVDANLAPRAVYVVFWAGFTVVSVLVGDVWRALSPFDTLCAIGQWLRDRLAREASPPRPYPPHWGYWPAAIGLFGFVWMELVYPDAGAPRTVAFAMEVYTLAVLAGAAMWGREWLTRGEAFTAYFGFLSHLAPFYRGGDGRIRVRPPLAGLARLRPAPGLAAVVFVAIGSTGFDGLSRTRFWGELTAGQFGTDRYVSYTLGLAWVITAATVLYAVAMRVAGRLTGHDPEELAAWFLPSLVPITFGYAVAHSFTLLIFETQMAVVLASDPLGRGWDLIGTATWIVNVTFVTDHQIAWAQAGAIVGGHVGGVIMAHDRAVARLPRSAVRPSQYPLLVAMVIYTVGGLALLFGR